MNDLKGNGALSAIITIVVLVLIVYFIWYGFFREDVAEVPVEGEVAGEVVDENGVTIFPDEDLTGSVVEVTDGEEVTEEAVVEETPVTETVEE